MSDIDQLLAQIPMDQLGSMLGVAPEQAASAVREALPTLLAGMQANAQDPRGAASLADALGQHDAGLLDGGIDFDQVDTDDGSKIVSHVFGDNEDQVVSQLGGLGGLGGLLGGGMMSKLLPMLAPLVMAWLAKSFSGQKNSAKDSGEEDSSGDSSGGTSSGGGGLGDILGGLLGGGSAKNSDNSGSAGSSGGGLGGLGDIFGGLLGGGSKK